MCSHNISSCFIHIHLSSYDPDQKITITKQDSDPANIFWIRLDTDSHHWFCYENQKPILECYPMANDQM